MSSFQSLSLFVLGLCVSAVAPCEARGAAGGGMHPLFSASGSSFSIVVSAPVAAPAKVGVGLAASLLVTIAPANGSAAPVALTCADLPQETSCAFALTTIPAGGGATTMLFNTTAPHVCGTTTPFFYGTSAGVRRLLPEAGPVFAGLLLLWPGGWRRRRRLLHGVAVFSLLLSIVGCGSCTDLGTLPGTYTFSLVGGGSGAAEVVTVPVTVTVGY